MSNQRYKQLYRVVFLCAAVVLSISLMCSTWHADHQGKFVTGIPYVSVNTEDNITGKNVFFEAAMSQTRQQLKNKTDVLMEFEEAPLKQRKEHVNQVCSWMRRSGKALPVERLWYYKNTSVLFCTVPKVGTKFWFRLLHVLETGEYIPRTFERKDGPKSGDRIKSGKKSEIEQRTNFAKKIMFTRDPYKRIFSSYVDKLVSPNSEYWSLLGRRIIRTVRKPESNTVLNCGHDVQFGELVQYLIKSDPETYDIHFKPVSSQCDVCDIHFDMIGKVETFKHDVMYVLNMTNATEKGVMFKDFVEEWNVDNIIFKVRRAFKYKKKSLQCISDHMVHLRLWRVLQIGGLIDKHDEYPLNPDESREANETMIMNLMLSAYERSTPKARLNKQEALLQAYSQVSLEDLKKLRLKYLKDLLLFDYEDRPSYLFDRKGSGQSETKITFDYYDAMRLSL